jgi:hypothetical protein
MKFFKTIIRKNKFTASLLEVYFFSKNYLKPKGWFLSRFKYQPLDLDNQPIPWLTYSAIHFINQKLKKQFRVFEYGSGNSTIWFASKVKHIVSIEHDPGFYSSIYQKITLFDNVAYELIELKDSYSQKIQEYRNEFDIVIIDGRERVQCTKNSISALKQDGIIIFDNSDRTEYNECFDYLVENDFKKIDFKGVGPIGHVEWQTSIFYRVDNCFDI